MRSLHSFLHRVLHFLHPHSCTLECPRLIHLLPRLRERLLARRAEQEEGEEYVFPEVAWAYADFPLPPMAG